ncbi:hypothetical protein [Dyadobacter sp. LHD-138]|uniref:hypothetical protein n=1 Tax=Dyadobacter sp. LHD-138 TaxID=3071413 RepID=UPI0027E10E70|nr:hypothetical protein [Dyadobacter sp. LHD-138]MDQ6478292.1 hypothetical protein [Dyadobacter sp. LHD-138]
MKIGIILFGLLAWISCNEEKIAKRDVETIESEGEWVNMLATDGCSWHFEIPAEDKTMTYYLPDDNSRKEIEKVLGKKEDSYSFTKVRIRYSLTGRKRDVQCGWGATNSYDEIAVYEITKK